MLRLLTDLARDSPVGAYVSALARAVPECEVYYRRSLSPDEYERTRRDRSTLGSLWTLGAARTFLKLGTDRTHVTWEGFGPALGKRTRLLTVHHVSDASVLDGTVSRSALYRLTVRGYWDAARWGTTIVVPSQSVADDLVKGYEADPSRIHVIPQEIDTDLYAPMDRDRARASLGLPKADRLILHVGSDDARKDAPTILRTFRILRQRIPGARLVQVGRSHLLERARDEGVTVLSDLPQERLCALYSAANVLFHPSRLEGFSRVVLEAMACGTTPVVSDLPVFREELSPYLLARPVGDSEGFARVLGEVLMEGGPWPASELRRWVGERFSGSSFRSAYVGLYREMALL